MLTRADLAKYPFLAEAQEYIRELGFTIEDIAQPEFSPVLERAEKRLEEALAKGRISQEASDEKTEILSFPISNLILSLTGEERARRRFALAEAKKAYERLKLEDPEKLEQIATRTFNWKVEKADRQIGKRLYEFSVGLTDYLRNSVHLKEPKWKLSNRIVDHGRVYTTREETARLLEEEVRSRIADRTTRPPAQPPALLQPRVDQTKTLIVKWLGMPTNYELPKVPMPEAMPPCIRHLIDELAEGKNVAHMGRFALAAFLSNIGTAEDEVVRIFKPATDFSERMTRYQVEHIAGRRGGRTKYTCPMCTTLKTHSVCYKPDEVCSTIRNPLSYYKTQARTLTGRGPRRGPG
jgi:DNA primase large subunit